MATSLTETKSSELETVTFSFPISKMETDADGDLVVKGVATDGSVDSDYQIVDPEWSAKALGDWLSTGGNVRMAHDPQRPVGKGLSVEIDRDGDGKHWVKSVIVDPVAKRLVEKGVLRAYSVGISHPVIKRDPTGKAPGGIITGGELSELSIVDRPANKNSYLELAKSAGSNQIEFTGILHEGIPDATLSKAAGTFTPADLAKLIEHRRVAEKRDFDPNVGGGVDRDKMPASDFVDPKRRRFPIHSADDVSDAVSSYGHAKPKIPFDKFKRRVTAIARRKGFESSLPEEWKNGSGDAKKYAGVMQANPPQAQPQPGQVPAPGPHQGQPLPHPAAPMGHAAPPAGPQHQMPGAPQPHMPGDPQQPVQAPQTGSMPPGGPMMAKDHMAATGHQVQPGMGFCPDCGSPMGSDADTMDKGNMPPADPTDSNGHMTIDMPMGGANKADVPNSGSVGEPQMTTPVDSVAQAKKKPKKQGKPSSLMPETEAYAKKPKKNGKIPTPKEAPSTDALPGVGKSVGDPAMDTAMLLKQLDVPSDLGALHDLLCPGFHPADSEKCHPGHSLKSLDVTRWQSDALNAAASAPLDQAAGATERWQAAESIKSMAITDPTGLLELRHEAHKAFSDAQIGPGTAPVPTQIRAGQFKKPYITDGHARRSMQAEGPNTADVPTGGIAASNFTDGYLSAGHADESPSNKGQKPLVAYPEMTGRLQTVDYSGASRQAAKSAMNALHDHIAHTFPDLCPMGSPGGTEPLGHVPMGDTTVPQPTGEYASKSETQPEITKAYGAAEVTDLIKSMKDEFTAELRTLNKSLKAEKKRNAKLKATVDSMASMPDPTVAAFKGVALTHPINKGAVVSARTVAETAEQTQLMMMRELENQWRTSDNPAQREAAWASLMKMRGLT